MNPHWHVSDHISVTNPITGVTISGPRAEVERATAAIDGTVGLANPEKVRVMVSMLQILVGNRSAESFFSTDQFDRGMIATALAEVLG